MEDGKLNLFIVADNALVVNGLRHYLKKRYGAGISVSNFYNKKSFLKNVNENTQVVILDYTLGGKPGIETLKTVKAISPVTEVIMHSSHEDVVNSIEAFQKRRSADFENKYNHKFSSHYN